MLRLPFLLPLFTLIALFTSAACGDDAEPRACTEIGCTSGLTVELTEGAELADDTLLRLDFDFDGEVRSCELSGAERPRLNESCGVITFEWDGDRLRRFIIHDRDPNRFGIELRLGDELLYKASLEPEYMTVQPNGPSCPPECRQATVKLLARDARVN